MRFADRPAKALRHRGRDRYNGVGSCFLPRFDIHDMPFSLGSLVDRWSRLAIAGCVLYGCVISVILLAGWGGEQVAGWIGAWGTFPIMFTMLFMLWPVITDR